MDIKPEATANTIVLPAPSQEVQTLPPRFIVGQLPVTLVQSWAPAWFYSALNWLGKSYYDASNVQQSFNDYMVGSDVDPYSSLGSTRLFVITKLQEIFQLTLASDSSSNAPLSGGTTYPNTDEGILQMYQALSASPIFSSVNYCYVPGRLAADVNPDAFATFAVAEGLESGYDTASGLRTIVLGSAVSQVVPLDDFLQTQNEQIYDDSPVIVPLVTALVYDLTQYNTVGATTFLLPVYYTRDQVSPATYYVSRLGSTTTVAGQTANCGQTALFPGGAGYSGASATSLTVQTTSVVSSGGETFTTYNFGTATAVTTSTLSPSVETGVMSLTYSGSSPSTIFAAQGIIGFYRDSSWTTSLGVPIYDFGAQNSSFTAATQALVTPATVYDPTNPFLNGGSLPNVIHKLTQAAYVYSTDELVSILDTAIAAKDTDNGAGLSVTTAALEFDMSSNPAASVVDQLTVPVTVTVTTTPTPVKLPTFNATTVAVNEAGISAAAAQPATGVAVLAQSPANASVAPKTMDVAAPAKSAAMAAAPTATISKTLATVNLSQLIGSGASAPGQSQLGPVTVQVGLSASIPREALSGTGITGIEIGTAFPQQPLGAGAAFEAVTAGMAFNLMDRHSATPSLAPVDLATSTAGYAFADGVYYVLSLTGANLTVRGSDDSSATSEPTLPGSPDPSHTYVGAMVYSSSTASVTLYPLLQLTLPAPSVGSHGVLQGGIYSVRLTFGDANSQYDVVDSTQTVLDSNVTVPNPKPADGSNPQSGDLYFGSFMGGASVMTVWSVPVFLAVEPSQLPGASYNGTMTLDALTSGLPGYQLQITDSSLFVYSNINVDTDAIGSVSAKNVYLASAVINSSPDDLSPEAFAPSKLVMGLVRQAQMGTVLKYVFVPEDDSVVIGGTRYMLSVINLGDVDGDPNSRPYPPVYWPQMQYWQFANRHDPYLAVEYTGATEQDRISQAQSDTVRIGLQTSQAQEPMQMYLDTAGMTVWPIYPFPYATSTQSVDQGKLNVITSTIRQILATTFPTTAPFAAGPLDAEQITLPASLQQNNPFTAGTAATTNPNPSASDAITQLVSEPSTTGLEVMNLSPDLVANTSVTDIGARQSLQDLQSQQTDASLSSGKSLAPQVDVVQVRSTTAAATTAAVAFGRQFQPIFGFSVYNPGTGEAYIVEVVDADLDIPDQLPDPTKNVTYDPYYVRVVFLSNLTCYNMSIIVPSLVRDQYQYFAHQGTSYQNLLSKTNELDIGYVYSLYDNSNNFDSLNFSPYPATTQLSSLSPSETYLYTNFPYSTKQTTLFSPTSLFASYSTFVEPVATGETATMDERLEVEKSVAFDASKISFIRFASPPAYFVCRRENWNADCHLMQATNPEGTSIYLAFGGGDLVPFRLDDTVTVDKRQPAHMYEFTYTFADQQYDSAQTISVANTPYVVAVATNNGVTSYTNFSINSTSGTADIQIGGNATLQFPTQVYIVGEASTTLTSISDINLALGTGFTDTGDFLNQDAQGNLTNQEFQVLTYNNLVYLIRAVSNVKALAAVGEIKIDKKGKRVVVAEGAVSGLLIDTYVPATTGNLALAQGARYQRSGLQFFGASYTPTTMQDSLDTLNFTSITGGTFYAPTIFIPIPELDSTKGFVANLSDYLGQQIWTFIYPEIVAQPDTTVNGVKYPNGYNLDGDGKPILSLQKLHFVYDPIAVMFTTNDLAHKYPLLPKVQILALTNGQIQEGICWRTANVQPQRLPPANILAQQILTEGLVMDATNIVYSSHNRSVITAAGPGYMGMSVNSFVSVSGVVYNIEEGALSESTDQTDQGLISAVASVSNMLVSVLFDYDNNDLGTLTDYDERLSTKGVVFLNGYLSATGYSFSSPDHFDVNDVLPSQVPLLEEVADIFGWDVAFYNMDASLPRQFWSLTYDTFTAPGLPNYTPNVPPPPVDPTFFNRTRSLVLSLQNPVRPTQLGLMDTYNSVVSANLHLENGVTGSIFLSKKADRDIASIGSNATEQGANQVYGLPTKYDFFIFSKDHYWTLKGAYFELVDNGYAMCLVDDGSGTGTKVAKYYIDQDGNYNELLSYVIYTPNGGIIESSTFAVKVTLGAPANPGATPAIPETPNNVNPQDVVAQINKVSNLVYAAFGPSSPGQPPAYIPIQAVGGEVQATPILGPPGFNGYALNVLGANSQPVQISQIFSANVAYNIAGPTTIVPYSQKSEKAVPFYGSISHGLDKMVPVAVLRSADLTSYIPATTVPAGPTTGLYGGNGLGGLIGTPFSFAFQGSGAIPPAIASNPTPGTTMKADSQNLLHIQRRERHGHGLHGQVGERQRRPVLRRHDGPGEPHLRCRHPPQVPLQREHLHGQPEHNALRRRDLQVHAGRRWAELPLQLRQPGHGRQDDVHLQQGRRTDLHRHLRGGRRTRRERGSNADHLDTLLHSRGRPPHRDHRRLQQPGRAEGHPPRRDRTAVHLRPDQRPRHRQRRGHHDGCPPHDGNNGHIEQRLRLRDQHQRQRLHRQRRPNLSVPRLHDRHAGRLPPDDGAADVHDGRELLHLRPERRELRQRHGQRPDLPRQPLPVLDQRRGIHHQHQRPAKHRRGRRERLHDGGVQHPVRTQRGAVHHHHEDLAQRCDGLRAVQHLSGECRRNRGLRLPTRHAQRADRRERHDVPTDHLGVHVHDHDLEQQLHRDNRAERGDGHDRGRGLSNQQHHGGRRRHHLPHPRVQELRRRRDDVRHRAGRHGLRPSAALADGVRALHRGDLHRRFRDLHSERVGRLRRHVLLPDDRDAAPVRHGRPDLHGPDRRRLHRRRACADVHRRRDRAAISQPVHLRG